jgi:hypothetical protein
MARHKFTLGQVIAALRETQGLAYLAARRLGCPPSVVFDFLNRHAKVREAQAAARDAVVGKAEMQLFRAAERGEGWAVRFLRSRRGVPKCPEMSPPTAN